MEYISYLNIAEHLPIQKGDIINISSDLLKLMCITRENKEKFDANKFLDTFLEKVGKDGTIIIPTYNWDFCSGKTFDRKNTKSQVGSLGNIALKRDDFKRTRHPIYSHVIWGKDKEYLCSLDNITAFGEDSIFGYMYENSTKNLFIGLHYRFGLTFVHYAEEIIGVDYRYNKVFSSNYIDYYGDKTKKNYQFYVRDIEKCKSTVISPLLDKKLKSNYWNKYINDIYFGIVNLRAVGDIMLEDLRQKKFEIVYPEKVK